MKLTLTDSIQETMVRLAGKGMPINRMCWYCGVGERAYYNWLRKGDMGQEPYAAFAAAIRKAQGERADRLTGLVETHAKDDPATARWLLSRMSPAQFGDQGTEEDHTAASYAESTEEEVVEMFANDPKIQERVLEVLRAKRLESGDE